MDVKQLIHEYGEVTGRAPGWEKYMSVEDFIEFKKAAVQIPSINIESYALYDRQPELQRELQQTPQSQQKAAYSTQTESAPVITPTKRAVESSNVQAHHNNTEAKKEVSEIDIFKSMGE